MKRRDFLKFSSTGLAVVAVGSMADWPAFWRGSQASAATFGNVQLSLDMVEAAAEMVDGIQVPMWAFKVAGTDHSQPVGGARIPGPVLVALEGDRIRLSITNQLTQGGAHGFAIPGVSLLVDNSPVSQVVIPGGAAPTEIEFTAPPAGTYMYLDPLNAPVNRTMGLHGALVVLPDPLASNAPYSGLGASSAVQRLFDDLGTAAHFPGNPWDSARNAVWVMNVIDPDKAAAATAGSSAMPSATFLDGFLPQYFTINGKSGFFSAQHGHGETAGGHASLENLLSLASGLSDPQGNISIRGTVGQPLVIRNLNAGLMWNSPHIHGNHVYPLAHARINPDNSAGPRYVSNNLTMLDTWTMAPGDIRDILLPFIQPPDIPAAAWPPVQELFPLLYPMHDHNEISNTAAGANYPQGMVTHWQIDAPFDPTNPATAVTTVERAELRVKTGQHTLEGSCTVPNLQLAVQAGGSGSPLLDTRVLVGADGRFRFRGRALKALASHYVTLIPVGPDDTLFHQAGRTVPLQPR